jgi:hypothetical protein
MKANYKGLRGHDSLWFNYTPYAFGRFGSYKEGFALPIENEFTVDMYQKLITLDIGVSLQYDYVISLDGQVVEYFINIDHYELPFKENEVLVYRNGLLSVKVRSWGSAGGEVFIVEPEKFLIVVEK